MSKKSDSGKYWPYMILGFLIIGITLGYWTIKNTISLPVQESNRYMQKYQSADKNANLIAELEARFDSKYNLEVVGLEKSNFKPKNLKRKPHQHYVLNDNNTFKYIVRTKDGKGVSDANITLLLTRPSTDVDNRYINTIVNSGNGEYVVKDLNLSKPGRYILRAKISVGKDTKYIDTYGYKEPKKK